MHSALDGQETHSLIASRLCVQPYVAPMLLLPLLWVGLVIGTALLCVALKWLLLNRVQPKAYAKYSWSFQTKVVYAAVNVSESAPFL